MRTALIGHRGVGKTSLLKRITEYLDQAGRPFTVFDLDQEIETRTGKPVQSIFQSDGEANFRKLEIDTFQAIDQETSLDQNDVYLSIGAGFDPALVPDSWRVIWVRRPSDQTGRIFLDRPRLNPEVSAVQEFIERYEKRNAAYRERADEVLWIDEGLEELDSAERAFFTDSVRDLRGTITLLPSEFKNSKALRSRLQRFCRWGFSRFEIRDDLLTQEQVEMALDILPKEKVLMSFRDQKRAEETAKIVHQNGVSFDWPFEFGKCDIGDPEFVSLHRREKNESIKETLAGFRDDSAKVQKAALPTFNFEDLIEGHRWFLEKPKERVFLPMSEDGRWTWYRLLIGSHSPMNFLRIDEGSSLDQPTLLQWIRRREIEIQGQTEPAEEKFASEKFAAVLGEPVRHSRTPMEHGEYFSKKKASVFAIQISEEEWKSGALEILRSLGLRWAAVTAPLKTLAFETCQLRSQSAAQLKSVNTLKWIEKGNLWSGANTDTFGFSAMLAHVKSGFGPLGKIAVWGGGGTLSTIRAHLPQAEFFSAQTGENRSQGSVSAEVFQPDLLVWASSARAGGKMPHSLWRPKVVIDLNYAENSDCREYVIGQRVRHGVQPIYVSGIVMFKEQAKAQREFWEKE